MTSPLSPSLPHTACAGVSLKPQHYRTILDSVAQVGFFEVHAENYMGAGGPPHRYLTAIRERYPLSIHGVGLSIGADRALDRDHLLRLNHLVQRYQPILVSEHLAWSTHGTGFLNDLLPLPYTTATLARVVEHIDEVQEVLGRQILLENPSTYLAFTESSYGETEFIGEVARRSGCALLLDINNVVVASANQGWDPVAYLDAFALDRVGQIHLAGHMQESDEYQRALLIDTHDRQVCAKTWQLYRHTVRRIGPLPTLIEWDSNIPPWPVLVAEANSAQRIMLEQSKAGIRRQPMPLDRTPRRTDDDRQHDAAPININSKATVHVTDSQTAFAAALLDPSLPIPQGLVGPDGQPSLRRFNVYRNNVVAGLTGTLRDAFPALARIVGEAFFAAMARTYASAHPPVSPIMADYGGGFPGFVAAFAPARELPYLADVARLERAWLETYHASEASPLSPRAFAAVSAEELMQLRVGLHPSLRVVCSPFPILTLWQTNIASGVPTWVKLDASAQDVLLMRPGADVELRLLPPGGAAFIQALSHGLSPLASMECALQADRRFDLAANFTALVEVGALVALELVSNPPIPEVQWTNN